MLPFDSPQPLPTLEIKGLSIPRYGSLTVNEVITLTDAVSNINGDEFDMLTQLMLDWHLRTILASILIISRVDSTWTLLKTQSLEQEELNAIVELLFEERDARHKDAKPSKRKPKPMDWAQLYWKLNLIYPNDDRFNRHNFGNQPVALIEQALEAAQEEEIERIAAESKAIANVGVFFAASKGAKNPQSRWFSDCEHTLFVRRAVEEYPPEMAASFMRLYERGRVPEWVLIAIDNDLDMIRVSAESLTES